MTTENVGIFIDSKADLRGFKQAETAAQQLNKTVKMLATTLGVGYGARAIANFGKAAVKAFSEDEAAANRLATAVDNLGLSLSKTKVEDFIKKTETSAGILDDQLRPAMQALLTTTGSLIKSQELLNDAIQISRASGIDLATVSQDLANGYVGITKGLKKYNTGLTQAELKSKSFNEVLGVLLAKSAGAANDYLGTTAYKLDVLNVAAANAQETIGKGLVDAFARIGGGTEAKDAAKAIDNIAKAVSNVLVVIGTAIGAIEKFRKAYTNFLAGGDVNALMAPNATSTNRSSSPAGTWARTQQQRAAEAAAAKRQKELIAAQNKQTAELKKQAALKKASAIFDLEQIQLIAALKGKLSEEDRKRAELQLAILDGNVELAKTLSKEVLYAQDETGKLYKYFLTIGDTKIKNPFAYLDDWIIEFQKKLDALKFPALSQAPTAGAIPGFTPSTVYPAGLRPGDPGFIGPVIPSTNVPSGNAVPNFIPDTSVYRAPSGSVQGPQAIELKVSGDSALTKAIADSLQVQSLSGIPSSVQRLVSTFG